MEKELEIDKIKRTILAVQDLLESGIGDYYYGNPNIGDKDKWIETSKYGWSKYLLEEIVEPMIKYLNKVK